MTFSPAACDTLTAIFNETKTVPKDYDLILTGDLGVIGSDILRDMMNRKGYDIYGNHNDCGLMVFDIKEQDVHSGGSGCGCCGSVFAGYIMKLFERRKIDRMILMATGALMNPLAVFQGETIPAIAHGLVIEREI